MTSCSWARLSAQPRGALCVGIRPRFQCSFSGSRHSHSLRPEGALLRLLLDDVLGDGGAAVRPRRPPLQVHAVGIPVHHLRRRRLRGRVKGVLCHDTVPGGAVRAVALFVHRLHAELIFMALNELLHTNRGAKGVRRMDPSSRLQVLLLHDVVGDLRASVVFWRIPAHLRSVFGDVGDSKRLRCSGNVHHHQVDGRLVRAIDIAGGQLQLSAIFSLGALNQQMGFVVLGGDNPAVHRRGGAVHGPLFSRWGLTGNRHIQLHLLAGLDANVAHVGAVNLRWGVLWPRQVRPGGVTGHSLTALIDRPHAELVNVPFDEVLHLARSDVTLHLGALRPVGAVLVLLLNDVPGNRRAAVRLRALPVELHPLRVVVGNGGRARLSGLLKGVLRQNFLVVRQRVRVALSIDCLHPELVLLTGRQAGQLGVTLRPNSLRRLDPVSGHRVQLLDDVVVNGQAAVIVGRAPLQRGALRVHVLHFEGATRGRGAVEDHHLHLGLILAVLVRRLDGVDARVGPRRLRHF